MHAMFIYHFTKYINWPENDSNGEFTIGILGKSPLKEELQLLLKNKTINNQKVSIRPLKETSDDNKFCDIIFIAESESNAIKTISSMVEHHPVLLITEKQGLIQKGAAINFLVINEKLRFEISKTCITNHNLKVSNELLKLATDVQ